jgi:hypothetical protein
MQPLGLLVFGLKIIPIALQFALGVLNKIQFALGNKVDCRFLFCGRDIRRHLVSFAAASSWYYRFDRSN